MYKEQVEKARKVLQKKTNIEKMTIQELTTICKPLKRKEDSKVPNKKDQLILKYREWSGRPAPSFDVSHLMEYNNDERETGNSSDMEDDSTHSDKVTNDETENIEIAAV